jgi:ring-1,2-phenylacetyl-CoA epoxidase subunit PaaD
MVELPNGDFAFSVARLLLVSAFADPFWRSATASTDHTIAAVAAKAEKETAYHLRHAAEWLIRLGDGTAESHRRAQTAIDDLWPYTGELFASIPDNIGVTPDPASLHETWIATVGGVLARATLARRAHWTPYRAPRPPAGRDAVPPTQLSRCHMVAASLRERALNALETVTDPEIPVLTIADLGILRDLTVHGETVEVTITPTYSGCPAMNMIVVEIETALARKLAAFGIAPPEHTASRRTLFGEAHPVCPLCGSADTEQISEFGSTACKSLHRCRACREPFDAFKCH